VQPNYPPLPGPAQRHSVVDITFTVILGALAGLSALGAVLFSFLYVMATDSCGSHSCNFDALSAAYIVTWGGIGLAIVIGAVGIVLAAVRNYLMWIWPAISLVLIAVSTGIGVGLANSVMRHG
jgi:hypothetical protein